VINLGEIDKAINAAGNRYMLCVLASQRAKQLYRGRGQFDGRIGSCIKQALQEVIRGQINYFITDSVQQPELLSWHEGLLDASSAKQGLLRAVGKNRWLPNYLKEGQTLPMLGEKPGLEDYALLSLYALARLNLEEGNYALVGETYSMQVGVSAKASEEFESQPFDITVRSKSEHIPFDFTFHITGSLELVGDWHKRLLYDPLNADLQSVDFKFRVIGEGKNQVDVDCYYQRRWLRTFQFDFDSVEVHVLESAVA
jgi:DNA-directed RNA polymerase subunit K/omega